MEGSSEEEEGWVSETKQVDWTFAPGEDVIEKLSKLYPFRSAYQSGSEPDTSPADENFESCTVQPVSIRQSSPDIIQHATDSTEPSPIVDLSAESIDHLKELILKDFRTETIRCVVMDDPDENNCVIAQLHFKNPDIQKLYDSLSDLVSLVAIGQPCVKHIYRDQWVAVDYMGTWHRAIVNVVLSHSLITVKLVDHGASVSLPLSAMRLLPEKLIDIPARAMHCRLLGSTSQIHSGCVLEAFPLPSSISNGVIKEPLPLKIINPPPCDDDSSVGEVGLHHTLHLDSSPTCSRRPPLPQQSKQSVAELTPPPQREDSLEKALLNSEVVNGVSGGGLKESHPFVLNSECESDIYDMLCRSYNYPMNVTSPLSTSESSCSSDVGSVFSETNGAISHVQRLIENERTSLEHRVTIPTRIARTKSEHKTSAVSTLCCRIRSSVLRKKP